jgi:hypothetical protein
VKGGSDGQVHRSTPGWKKEIDRVLIDEALDGLDRFLWAALDIVFDEFDGIHAIAQLDGAGLVHVFSPQNVVGVHCKTGASSVGAALGERANPIRGVFAGLLVTTVRVAATTGPVTAAAVGVGS